MRTIEVKVRGNRATPPRLRVFDVATGRELSDVIPLHYEGALNLDTPTGDHVRVDAFVRDEAGKLVVNEGGAEPELAREALELVVVEKVLEVA